MAFRVELRGKGVPVLLEKISRREQSGAAGLETGNSSVINIIVLVYSCCHPVIFLYNIHLTFQLYTRFVFFDLKIVVLL